MRWSTEPSADKQHWHLYFPLFKAVVLDTGEKCWGEWINRRWVPSSHGWFQGTWEYRAHQPNTRLP